MASKPREQNSDVGRFLSVAYENAASPPPDFDEVLAVLEWCPYCNSETPTRGCKGCGFWWRPPPEPAPKLDDEALGDEPGPWSQWGTD